jgi:hypothetical protein
MPRLMDLHRRLIEDDGETELSLATSPSGTTFKLKFNGRINAPNLQTGAAESVVNNFKQLKGKLMSFRQLQCISI